MLSPGARNVTGLSTAHILVIRKSVEVLRSKFQHARLEMDYWPDYSDQGALAQIELEDED